MASHPEFGEQTTGTEVALAFSSEIRDKIVLITGVSPNSLGESVALTISKHSPSLIILASRTYSNIELVASKIHIESPNIPTKIVYLDLSNRGSIFQAALQILADSQILRIDVLINTAAISFGERKLVKGFTSQEIELHFATNHIGPFLFTNLLMPKLLKTGSEGAGKDSARVVNVTSQGHVVSPIRFSDYNFDVKEADGIPMEERPDRAWLTAGGEKVLGFLAYAQSKTGNILFSRSLNEKLGDAGLLSIAVHPGSIWTNLPRSLSAEGKEMIRKTCDFWKSHDEGAATILVAAFDPALTAISGFYMSDCQMKQPADHASDPGIAERLWKLSERLVGKVFDFGIDN